MIFYHENSYNSTFEFTDCCKQQHIDSDELEGVIRRRFHHEVLASCLTFQYDS